MENKMDTTNKASPENNERRALIFRYISLTIQKKRQGKVNGILEEIRKKLNLSHQEIIDAASEMSIIK